MAAKVYRQAESLQLSFIRQFWQRLEVSGDFRKNFELLKSMTYDLLGFEEEDIQDHSLMINQFFMEIERLDSLGNVEEVKDRMTIGWRLLDNLLDIRNHNPIVFDVYRRKIKGADEKGRGNFYGTWFEARTYLILIRTNLNFGTVPERPPNQTPDFVVEFEGDQYFIECTSLNIVMEKEADLSYKLDYVVGRKRDMEYANRKTALFIDATLAYSGTQARGLDIERSVSSKGPMLVNSTNYGNLSIFYDAVDPAEAKERRLGTLNSREDHPKIDHGLKRLLDIYFDTK